MNQEVKKQWLERLRSGQISQGAGYLGRDDTRCCLGVLCDIAVEQKIVTVFDGATRSYGGRRVVLPDEVAEWAGLECCDPFVAVSDEMRAKIKPFYSRTCLSTINDAGYSFANIADLIEAQL